MNQAGNAAALTLLASQALRPFVNVTRSDPPMPVNTASRRRTTNGGRRRRSTFKRRSRRAVLFRPRPGLSVTRPYGSGTALLSARLLTKLKFGARYNTTSSDTQVLYRGNDIYNPQADNPIIAGSQPRGYDQIAQFYSQYRVLGSKIKVTMCNIGATPMYCAITPTAATDTIANGHKTVLEGQNVKWLIVPNDGNNNMVVNKMFRKTGSVLNKHAHNQANLINASPQTEDLWNWSILTGRQPAAGAVNADIWVQIIYYVQFSGRKRLPADV